MYNETPASPPALRDPLIPGALQSLLDWNPPELELQKHKKGGSISKATGVRHFYDRHLTPDLILKHFQYHPQLAAQIASTVDAAIKDALADGGTLPPPGGKLLDEDDRNEHIAGLNHVMSRELPIAVFYGQATAQLCIPVASTLSFHPRHNKWSSLLSWSMAPNAAGFAKADGSLQILDQNDGKDERTKKVRAQIRASMDPDMIETVRKLATTYPDLAVWEMKSLTVGDEDVMVGIKRSAMAHRPFIWNTCLCDGETYKIDRMDAVDNTRASPDAPSTPWTIPEICEELTQSLYASDADDGNEIDTIKASPPATADPGYSTSSVLSDNEGSEAARAKDKGKGKEVSKSPTKRKRDNHYKSTATDIGESFVQQAWAQAVRTDSTIIVLHSGNHEFVCIRHRESQTLYVSDIIHPPTCKAPAYGKLHIGIYIAAIQDAIQRMEHGETLPADQQIKFPPSFTNPKKRDGGNDGKGGGRDRPVDGGGASSRGGNKRQKKDDKRPHGGGKGRTRFGGSSSKPKQRTRASSKFEREARDKTILEANRRDIVLVFLCYGIYDSPNPAAFFRKAPAIVAPGQTPTPPPTPKPRKSYAAGTYSTIVLTSEIGQGSTGKVHGGIFTLGAGDYYTDLNVAVKLSFDEEEQERLLHEYFMYRYLNSKGVEGIPTALGLFVDPEDGPSALVLTHRGQSIFHRSSDIEYFQREAFQTTLKAIHAAGVLHGDIRSPNLLIDEFGESSIIDFDQAEKNDSEEAQEAEFQQLCRILERNGEY